MENIEQRFYDFVRQQLEKKKDKQVTRNDDEDIMSKNFYRLENKQVNDNIKKVLEQTKKRMKISRITKEMIFQSKLKEFSQLDTFIDVKKFLKELNSSPTIKQKISRQNISDSESDQDQFDYAGIVQKSKKFVAKSLDKRSRPQIKGYLIQENDLPRSTKDIEEQRSENEKFYIGIDDLITDINEKDKNKDFENKFENDRKKQRQSLMGQQIARTLPVIEIPNNDEEVQDKEKQFKQKSKKVLQLLEKTTKILYSNKAAGRKPPPMKKSQHFQSQPIVTLEQDRSLFLQFNDIPQKASFSYLPQISPNVSTLTKISSLQYVHQPSPMKSVMYMKTVNHNQTEQQNLEQVSKQRTQMEDFLQNLDVEKKKMDKMMPTEKQIVRLQNRMKRNMKKIGHTPLESLQALTKREFKPYLQMKLNSKKQRPLQII
ncbi:hypothetical protein pb186bvf_010754 [Paramecium bursaria]